jgi:UDP-glucose 4-epimerase
LIPFPEDRKMIDIGDYYADFRKIEGLLGWTPQVGLKDGLRQTLDFYRRHKARYWDQD